MRYLCLWAVVLLTIPFVLVEVSRILILTAYRAIKERFKPAT